MKLYLQYLWTNRRTAAVLAVWAVIFCMVFWLYRIPVDTVLYAAILSAVFGFAVMTVHFLRWRQHYMQRERMMQAPCLLQEPLPEPDHLTEAQYQEMLKNLRTLYTEQVNRTARERTDTIDYFTQWVHQIKTPVSVMRMLFIRRKLRILYDGTAESALTDEKWLQFILEQILSNAVKYTDTGSVTVTVSGQKICIADTGKGIAPEDLPRIFEKGYTGMLGRADKQATGIGLYLCKKAADRLNIGLTAESEYGSGSAFTLDLHSEARQYE